MSTPTKKIEGQIKVWISDHQGPEHLQGSPTQVLSNLVYHRTVDDDDTMWKSMGYTLVGIANISVDLFDENELIEAKVASLHAQKTKVLADAQLAVTKLDGQIQSLLCIGYAG